MSRILKVLTSPWGEGVFVLLVAALAGLLLLWQGHEVELRVKEAQATLDDQAAAWSDLLRVKFMAFDELLSLPEGLPQAEERALLRRRFDFWASTSKVPGLAKRLILVTTTSDSVSSPPSPITIDTLELVPSLPSLSADEAKHRAVQAIRELWNAQGVFRLHALVWESGIPYLTVWMSEDQFGLVELDQALFFGPFLKTLTDKVFPHRTEGLPDFVPALVESRGAQRVLFTQYPVNGHSPLWGSYPLSEGDLVPTVNPVRDPGLAGAMKELKLDYSYYLEQSIRGEVPEMASEPTSDLAFTYLPTQGRLHDLILLRNLPLFALGYVALLVLGVSLLTVSRYGRRMRQLSERQEEFVSTMTHELRTPIHVISNGADNLSDGIIAEPAEVRRYGQILKGEADRLSRMIEGILTYAGVARQLPVAVLFSLDDLLEEVLGPYRILCRESTIDLVVDAPPDLVCRGDPEAVKLILSNLLSNAIRHGASGRWIRLVVAHGPGLSLAVHDRGQGLSRKQIAQLTEPYFRVASPRGSGRFGHGLGLSIVQRIVKAEGGKLTISSRQGGGSEFTIQLPYGLQEEGNA